MDEHKPKHPAPQLTPTRTRLLRAPLTPRRKELLDFIKSYVHAHGYAPTIGEMANHLGVTRPTIYQTLQRMIPTHITELCDAQRARKYVPAT